MMFEPTLISSSIQVRYLFLVIETAVLLFTKYMLPFHYHCYDSCYNFNIRKINMLKA